MSQRKRNNCGKISSSSSSSSSSEHNLWQTTDKAASSQRRSIYPNVPKRAQQFVTINEHDTIQTESRIDIVPAKRQSRKSTECSSIMASSNQNTSTSSTLDLIAKYTSPQKHLQESRVKVTGASQPVSGIKCKRTLSPLNETNQRKLHSKRLKPFDEDEDENEDELSQFLDHRRIKQSLSQNSNTTLASQLTIDVEPNKPTTRKPTVRKLSTSTNKTKPILSQTPPLESPPIQPLLIEFDDDDDVEEEREEANRLPNCSQKHSNQSKLTPIIPSPIKLLVDTCLDSLNLTTPQNIPCTPIHDRIPPYLNIRDSRRFSSASSASLAFDTPCSSFSRTTTSNMTSTPQDISKTDQETQISFPSNIDLINQLISRMNLNLNDIQINPNYNPTELSKKLFLRYTRYPPNDNYQTIDTFIVKKYLSFGRYEMEIPFTINTDKFSITYVCDACLKDSRNSSMALQRHTAKCLATQPPGKLVYNENDLAIFQIGQATMNMHQRVYTKSVCRIARFFLDPNQSIDDTDIDRFAYYILCRRDPILSQSQPSLYRFVGYFSKQRNQPAQQTINNLSCLFILPCFAQHEEYCQLLITYSYFLIRSSTLMYSSPARPLDKFTLTAFRKHWCAMTFAYLIHHHSCAIKTLALDILARQTSIHPRDILSGLYSNGSIVSHPFDKSSVYLLNKAYHSMTSFNLQIRNEVLFMGMKMIDTTNEKNLTTDKQKIDEKHDSNIEEIVLD